MNSLDNLPNFEQFSYSHVKQPLNSKLVAWSKLKECERRLEMYKWVEQNNDTASPRYRVLLNDALSAFLLTFEAAIQHANDQYKKSSSQHQDIGQWLSTQPEYNIIVKGVRTLRLFEAHVEAYPVASDMVAIVGGAPTSSFSRRWSLQKLECADIDRLNTPKLKTASDLAAWNAHVESRDTINILSEALDQLNILMQKLERII